MSDISRFEHYGLSDIGLKRLNNEDVWNADSAEELYLVADGMGGHAAGEVAAGMAVTLLSRFFLEKNQDLRSLKNPEASRTVADLLETVNRQIYETGMARPEQKGMGTTVVLCLARNDRILIAHVGDSRAYLFRADKLCRLTKDHSVFQELLESGRVSENEQRGHPGRFQLTQCLGHGQKISPAIAVLSIEPGDRILLCSDGLHDMLSDTLIHEILLQQENLREACEKLVAEANRSGGLDNITVLMMRAEQA